MRTWICNPMARAAVSTSRNVAAVTVALAGLTSAATRMAEGTNARRSSSRFADNSLLKKLIPVRLPLGRARLATRPRVKPRGLLQLRPWRPTPARGLRAARTNHHCTGANFLCGGEGGFDLPFSAGAQDMDLLPDCTRCLLHVVQLGRWLATCTTPCRSPARWIASSTCGRRGLRSSVHQISTSHAVAAGRRQGHAADGGAVQVHPDPLAK